MAQQQQEELNKALIEAAENGHVEVCLFLIEQGANVNATNWLGWTPLLLAAYSGYVDVCRLLIERGANVNATTDNDGMTPLHCAAANGYVDVCRLLIERGANVNAIDRDGMTPLHCAAANGYVKVCRLLIQAGADVNATTDNDGMTPLHCAAFNGHVDVCRLLIQAKANVHAVTRNNETPLDLAIRNHAVEALAYFYVHGVVNFHQPDHTGRRPWDRLDDEQREVLKKAKVVHQEKIAILQTRGLPNELARLVMGYL